MKTKRTLKKTPNNQIVIIKKKLSYPIPKKYPYKKKNFKKIAK